MTTLDWTPWRHYFPVTGRWAFFDHAAVAPPSGPARDALCSWAADVAENGAVNERRWLKRIEEVRGLAGRLLNADPLDIAFIKNTSEGIGIVAEGFPWQPGDNLVTAAEEYPANIYPWLNLVKRGVEVRLVSSENGRISINAIRDRFDSRTRLLTLSFVEYASGFRNDLAALGDLCRQRGIYFFVDAIQGLGVLPFDVQALPIDFLAADGHKWLLGPEGAGLFYLRRELVELLHPVGIGWNSVVSPRNFAKLDFRLKPNAGRWESGTLNVGGIVSLGASLDLLLQLGLPAISARVLELTELICEAVTRLGLTVFSSRLENEKSGIVSVAAPGDVSKLVRGCRDAGVIINQRAGRLRFSPHFYNTKEEIEQMERALENGLNKRKPPVAG